MPIDIQSMITLLVILKIVNSNISGKFNLSIAIKDTNSNKKVSNGCTTKSQKDFLEMFALAFAINLKKIPATYLLIYLLKLNQIK